MISELQQKGITNRAVLTAMKKVPRHLFVEEAIQHKAYGDHPLPIGEKQTISQPYMVALMTEALELTGSEKVLEIGTGSGYQSAILCELAEKVYTIERLKSLGIKARNTLEKLNYLNFSTKIFDGTYGWSEYAPFDRIIVTAVSPEIPTPLLKQLSEEGGVMVIPVSDDQSQNLMKIQKQDGQVTTSKICDCTFVKLIGAHGWEK